MALALVFALLAVFAVAGMPSGAHAASANESPDKLLPAAKDPYVHFQRADATWEGELDGRPLTVTGAKYFGVDVDESNGAINWTRAKADGVGFALIRCGVGSDTASLDDRQWSANVAGVKANDVPFGVVLYSYATDVNGAKSEASHALRLLREANVQPSDMDYPVYYDLERNPTTGALAPSMLAEMAETFCDALAAEGYDVGVYSTLTFWNEYLTDPVFNRWERWIAQWLTEGRENAATTYKGDYALWQCLATGSVDGIGRVNVNFDYRQRLSVPQSDQRPGAVLRVHNPYSGAHLFTPSTNEVRSLLKLGWLYEGREWTAPTAGTAVYRLYNPFSTDHFYTSNRGEYDNLGAHGWNQEGVSFYTDPSGSVPIYRLFNPYVTVGTHHFTRSYTEYRTLAAQGWEPENVAFYGVSA